jgi:hypothetical protein
MGLGRGHEVMVGRFRVIILLSSVPLLAECDELQHPIFTSTLTWDTLNLANAKPCVFADEGILYTPYEHVSEVQPKGLDHRSRSIPVGTADWPT